MNYFSKSFSTPDPIPEDGIETARRLMKTGHLFRYNPPEDTDNVVLCKDSGKPKKYSEVSMLEQEFCDFTGHKYAVAVNSCGSALFLALKAAGIEYGDKVLTNAFTFTAVPSSIVHAGGTPVYLECTQEYVLDLDHLRHKISQHPDARFLMLSYMRGHISDVSRIRDICDSNNITLIEDCAHSLGVRWQDDGASEPMHIGHHGTVACFSAQSNKLINAGEGGILVTNDEAIAAYSILAAGSYEQLYQQHLARPEDKLFENIKREVPNFSLRMSNLAAAVLRPQLPELEDKINTYNEYYETLEGLFADIDQVDTPQILPQVSRVGDSFQFNLTTLTAGQLQQFMQRA